MSGIAVSLDPKGVFGPTLDIIYNIQNYNKSGLKHALGLLKEKFISLAKIDPVEEMKLNLREKEFIAFWKRNYSLTPQDVISSKLFRKSYQVKEPLPVYHEKMMGEIVPQMIRTFAAHIPQANRDNEEGRLVKEWAARFVECFMPEEVVKKGSSLRGERENVELKLQKDLHNGNITEHDLECIVQAGRAALEKLNHADHVGLALNYTEAFLYIFSLNIADPIFYGDSVLQVLQKSLSEKQIQE